MVVDDCVPTKVGFLGDVVSEVLVSQTQVEFTQGLFDSGDGPW